MHLLEGISFGGVVPHYPEFCSDCKNNKPCQYDVEGGEYVKLGKTDILGGAEFEVILSGSLHVQLKDSEDFLYDVPKDKFAASFYELE